MTNAYIYPDRYSNEDDLFEVIGEIKYRYYVEVETIEEFLIEYLSELNQFPIYFTLTTYDDYGEIETLLTQLKQEYELKTLGDVVYSSTYDGGMLIYHIPIFKIKITNTVALQSIISSTFWMAETNCKYIVSLLDNVSFTTEKGTDWLGKDAEFSTIYIDMSKETTTLGITHDAHGLYLFSNLDEHGSIENIEKKLHNYKVVAKE